MASNYKKCLVIVYITLKVKIFAFYFWKGNLALLRLLRFELHKFRYHLAS